MKHIHKNPSPEAFELWKQTPLADNAQLPDWDNLHGKKKQEVMRSLLQEQGWICCYCGARIGVRRGDCHIEHFRPRSHYPTLKLAYDNLFASCQGELPPEPNHCGHRKRDWFDESLTLSPLTDTTESALRFLEDGRVKPTPKHPNELAAHETIARLNLNASTLQRQRQAALDAALGLDLDEPLTWSELETLASALSGRDDQGRFPPFGDVLVQCLQRLLQSPLPSPSPPQGTATP